MVNYFGTDGIRGRANGNKIRPDKLVKLGLIIGYIIQEKDHKVGRVVIGKDTRESSYMVEQALTSGLLSAGIDVLLTGPVPTPGISMLTKSLRCDCGIMISASHNKYQDNGIKIFNAMGLKIPNERQEYLEKLLNEDIKEEYFSQGKIGRAKRIDAVERYIESVKSSIESDEAFDGLKVVIDCANGAAYKVAPTIFWELKADVIAIENNPNGKNINDNCGSTETNALSQAVIKNKADIGIALDGDADRLVVVDENGEEVSGDLISGMIVKDFKETSRLSSNKVIGTVMANMGYENFLKENLNLELIRTPVGDRNVLHRMLEEDANFGSEPSGHVILSDYSSTGDGIVTAMQVLSILKEKNIKASDIKKLFNLTPALEDSFEFTGEYDSSSQEARKLLEDIREIVGKNSNIVIRKSGTEDKIRILIDGDTDKEKLQKAMDLAVGYIKSL